MRKNVGLLVIVCVIMLMIPLCVQGSEIMDKFAVRITVIENGEIHEWEYDSPDKFEYETGSEVFRGEKAEKEVKQFISLLSLKEDTELEEMLAVLESRYPQIEHLDARMRSHTGQLYTWVWSKEQ